MLRVGRRMSRSIARRRLLIASSSKLQRKGRSGFSYRLPATRATVRLTDPPEVRRHDACAPRVGPEDDGTRGSTIFCLREADRSLDLLVSRSDRPPHEGGSQPIRSGEAVDRALRLTPVPARSRWFCSSRRRTTGSLGCGAPIRRQAEASPPARHHGIQPDPTPGPGWTQSNSLVNRRFLRPSRPRHRLVSPLVQCASGSVGR
jgi:hypothetical protein